MASSSDPPRPGGMDSILGYAPGTLERLYAVEQLLADVGLAQRQQILGGALWRSVTAHPCLTMTVDMDVESITLTRGGRRLSLEMAMFPPSGTRTESSDRLCAKRESERLGHRISADEAYQPEQCPFDCRGVQWGERWVLPRDFIGELGDGHHHPTCKFNAAWERRHGGR